MTIYVLPLVEDLSAESAHESAKLLLLKMRITSASDDQQSTKFDESPIA